MKPLLFSQNTAPLLAPGIRAWLLAACVVLYWLVCFFPYQWVAPASYTLNDARLQSPPVTQSSPKPPGADPSVGATGQRLVFFGAGLAELTPLTPWPQEVNSVRLAFYMHCAESAQFGPARLFTLSSDTRSRNLMIGQDGGDLVLRLRRPASNENGVPDYRVEGVFDDCVVRHFELRLQDSGLDLLIDGAQRLSRPAPEAGLERWASDFPMHLGNEGTWDRGWSGALWSPEVEVNGLAIVDGWETLVRPQGAWLLSRRAQGTHRFTLVPFSKDMPLTRRDNVLNVLGFLPFGVLLALGWVGRRSVLFAALLSASLSVSIEFGQIGFEGRFPSATDVVTNTLGGSLGFVVGALALGLIRRSAPDGT